MTASPATIDYRPPPTVGQFVRSEKFYSFIQGPVGSGKTTGNLFKILYHAARQAPSPQTNLRHTRWVIVRNTLQQLKDTTMKSFFSWFVPNRAGEWRASDNQFTFRFGDIHAEVLFRPLDTPDDVGRVLSLEVTGAVLDEFVEIPKEIVESLSGRCGRFPPAKDGGATWFGMWGASNPGNEDDWWYDWLFDAPPANMAVFTQPGGLTPQAENLENLPGGRAYYTNLVEGKSQRWVNQFVNVQWGHSLRGKPVFPVFDPSVHVAASPLIYNPHVPLWMGFDAGLTPAAVLGQVDAWGRILILCELTSEGMGARRFCRTLLRPLLDARFRDAQLIVSADPAVTQRAQTDERSVRQVLEAEMGVKVRPAWSNTLADRFSAVEERLTMRTEAGPGLIIDPSCRTLIRALGGGYRFATTARGRVADTPEKNHYSHVCEACQYMLMAVQREAATAERRRRSGLVVPVFENSYVY